jgi:hypothetical protein
MLCGGDDLDPEFSENTAFTPLVIGEKSRLHSQCLAAGVLSVNAFHEKAGRSQVDSCLMFFLPPPSGHCRQTCFRVLPSELASAAFVVSNSQRELAIIQDGAIPSGQFERETWSQKVHLVELF